MGVAVCCHKRGKQRGFIREFLRFLHGLGLGSVKGSVTFRSGSLGFRGLFGGLRSATKADL